MKLHFIKTSLLFACVFVVTLSGCLKDKGYDNGEYNGTHGSKINVISLGVNVASVLNFSILAYNNSPNDTVVDLIPVELGGPSVASQDIHVTLALADSLVNYINYVNDSTGSGSHDYIVPTAVTIVDSVVTIPKGSRIGYLQVKFVPANLIGVDYAMGFVVQSVRESGYTISGNLAGGVVAILIKNAYDGNYLLNIETTGWASYGISNGVPGQWPHNVIYASTGTYSNIIQTSEGYGTLQVAFTAVGAVTGFGATKPQYTIDPTSNLVTSVVNLAPDDGRGRAFAINTDPLINNHYDPVNKIIYVAYKMTQNGRPTQFIYDTLTYQGPR